MRIVSWNMNHSRRKDDVRAKGWNYLREDLRADLALVQEAVPPPELPSVYRPLSESNRNYNWGSAVVALGAGVRLVTRPRVPLASWDWRDHRPVDALPDSHPGASAVADILDDQGQFLFTAVSLYAQWEMVGGDKNYFACPKVHRILSDLTNVLSRAQRRPVVLAGDFNLTTQGGNKATAENAAAAFTRVRSWGLTECITHTGATRAQQPDCKCPDGIACTHVQTYRHGNKQDSGPTQLDYAFISNAMLPRLLECRVVHDEAAWALSDHCPVVLDLR